MVSEWAAVCGRCGADVSGEPLVPNAPRPPSVGGGHLTGGTEIRVTRKGLRGARFASIGVAVAVVAAVTVAAWRTETDHGVHARTAQAVVPFVPSTHSDGGTTVLAMTLLDGRRVELRYPSSLHLAQLGLTLATEIKWPAAASPSTCCWTRVSASRATFAAAYGEAPPLATYRGERGQTVRLLSAVIRRLPPGLTGSQNLVFQFAPWLVEVDTSAVGADGSPPPMTAQDRQMWAASLGASVGPGGYLVLHPRAPLSPAPAAYIGGTSALFGLGSPYEPQRDTLDIEDGYCGQPTSDPSTRSRLQANDGPPGVVWCDAASGLHITAIGAASFVDTVASGLSLTVTPSP